VTVALTTFNGFRSDSTAYGIVGHGEDRSLALSLSFVSLSVTATTVVTFLAIRRGEYSRLAGILYDRVGESKRRRYEGMQSVHTVCSMMAPDVWRADGTTGQANG
jgi:hypothetical protein